MAERRGRKAGQAWYLAAFQGIDLALQVLTGEPVRFLSFVTIEIQPRRCAHLPSESRVFKVDGTFTSKTMYEGAPQRVTSPGLLLMREKGNNIWRICGCDDALRLHSSESVPVSCLGLVDEWSLDVYFTYEDDGVPLVGVRQCDIGNEQIVGYWRTGHDLRDRKVHPFQEGRLGYRRKHDWL